MIEKFRFGISVLHTWIKTMEFLLKIAYMIPFKGLKKKDTPKNEQDDHKKSIQSSLKREIGILVDKPKPGYGLTNRGKWQENSLQIILLHREYSKSRQIWLKIPRSLGVG